MDEIIIEAYDNIETKGSATDFTYDVYAVTFEMPRQVFLQLIK